MIQSLSLKFGAVPGGAPLTIRPTPITIFVGPNNSGKSTALAELHRWCVSGQPAATNVVGAIVFDESTRDEAVEKVGRFTLHPRATDTIPLGYILVGRRGHRMQAPESSLLSVIEHPNAQPQQFAQWYLQHDTLMLDGPSRIALVKEQDFGDLQQPPQNSFQVLFREDDRRERVRTITYEAFGLYFVLDPTKAGKLRIRLARRPPASDIEERGLHQAAADFHGGALGIDEASDGIKAFTGIITEVMAGDPAVLLIDEPEAFLHPALAFKLGQEMSKATRDSNKRLFVATHSPDFVMGCIQSGAPVNIIRLTYRTGVASARVLPNDDIVRLMRNPLLRSTGVLRALFYESIVVTEADADRAFYQEINERLVRFSPGCGIPNCLFLNAQNKQTTHTLVRPLRSLGIATAAVVDIDIFKEGGEAWSNFLSGAFVPEIDRQALSTTRALVMKEFQAVQEADKKNMKRDGGLQLLTGEAHESGKNVVSQLMDYGLFVVEDGELEAWLRSLGASGHGAVWLVDVFEKMGENPDAPGYVMPGGSDVWAFVGKIKAWLDNPERRGIPG